MKKEVRSSKQIIFKQVILKKKSLLYFGLFLGILILIIILSTKTLKNKEQVQVLLNGEKDVKVSIFSEYQDDGIRIIDDEKILTAKDVDCIITDNININMLGKYEVTYSFTYKDEKYSLVRTVEIVDDMAPEILVTQEKIEKYFCSKESTDNIDYKVIDNYDGVITEKSKIQKFDDKYIISVQDASGNKAIKEIPVQYTTEPSPIVNLVGNDTIYIKKGGKYVENGAHATDGCGNVISDDVIITGSVDTNIVGTTEVIYTVETKTGKKAQKNRQIIIYDPIENEKNTNKNNKVIYLTFDDGPGQYTAELLDILKEYNVKATFFVTNQFKKYVPLIEREYNEGHKVAVHTLTHRWSIYQSVETYLKDFYDMNEIIYYYTGKRTDIFRFPGGSSNTISRKYSTGVVSALSSKMTGYGYEYFDWNVDSEDAAGANKKQIYNNVINGIKRRKSSVVLMHDIKRNTVSTIEDIINYALANGYTFEVLSPKSPTVHHHINN